MRLITKHLIRLMGTYGYLLYIFPDNIKFWLHSNKWLSLSTTSIFAAFISAPVPLKCTTTEFQNNYDAYKSCKQFSTINSVLRQCVDMYIKRLRASGENFARRPILSVWDIQSLRNILWRILQARIKNILENHWQST